MFVYVWAHGGVPFYVGLTRNINRANPKNRQPRGWFCLQKLAEVGSENVSVTVYPVESVDAGQQLEIELIKKYGRIQLGTGTLTNLRSGGEGTKSMSEAAREKTRARMKRDNPSKRPEVAEKIRARMTTPEALRSISGENNPAKRPEVRAKLKSLWADPEFRAARIAKKVGVRIHSDEHKNALREKLLDPTNPMRKTHEKLNSDESIRKKRVAALQTPEVRAKISAGLRARWEKRKSGL